MVNRVVFSGEKAVAWILMECGVEHFFYVMVGMMIYPAIEKEGVSTILCRNEKAACNMADGSQG